MHLNFIIGSQYWNYTRHIKQQHHIITSGGSIALSTASDMIKNEMNNKNNPFTNPASTSALT